MTDDRVLPLHLADLIEGFVESEHRNAERYDNKQVLDEGGVYSLYRLAATVYAAGFNDGNALALRQQSSARMRERERNREAVSDE